MELADQNLVARETSGPQRNPQLDSVLHRVQVAASQFLDPLDSASQRVPMNTELGCGRLPGAVLSEKYM